MNIFKKLFLNWKENQADKEYQKQSEYYRRLTNRAIQLFDVTEIENKRFLKISFDDYNILIPVEHMNDISSTINHLREQYITDNIKNKRLMDMLL